MNRQHRLQMAQRPSASSTEFKKTLQSWKRSTRYHGYGEATAYGEMLETWLTEVSVEVQSVDPATALALYEQFIELDSHWFEHADDSGGAIGMAMQAACGHWLRAAAECRLTPDQAATKLMALFQADHYGGREDLLRKAHLLLPESGLRALVTRFESQMDQVAPALKSGGPKATEVFKVSAALTLLSEALHDPDIKVRAVLSYSPEPNALQMESFVQAYLDAGKPREAMTWLQKNWGHMEGARQSLMAAALEDQGLWDQSQPIRKQLFESCPSVAALQAWLRSTPEADQPSVLSLAKDVAQSAQDVAAGVSILLELKDVPAAETLVIQRFAELDGQNYGMLLNLADAFEAHGRHAPETLIYRALLVAILERGYAKAYGHGAQYLLRLRALAPWITQWDPLQESHAEFEAILRQKHGRKTSFWSRV
ncbi:MAG: hypothetical protein EKK45_21095 [Curvibacter sp.]|nr:MAG: hypothetical protein EKK45_21095 [Curvibacter sp.]